MNTKLNKKKIIAIVVVTILIITNPSLKAFKEYQGIDSKKEAYVICSRKINLFVFSIYEYSNYSYGGAYFGMFGNFIELSKVIKQHPENN